MSLGATSPSAGLPAGELAEAVAACRKQDRRLDMYYKFASPTARRFVELGFYSNHFGERTDPALYARCRDAIAPTLSETDLLYLLRFESDPDTKDYLNGLLTQLHAPKPQAAPKPPTTPAPKMAAPKPRFPVKRKKSRKRFARRWSSGRDSSGGLFGPKALAALAVVSLVLVIGGIRAYVNDLRETEAAQRRQTADDDFTPAVASTVPSASRRPAQYRPKPTVRTATDLPAAIEETPVVAQAEEDLPSTNDAPVVVAKATKKPKLVLTDGTRIRTRPDGTVEVPRTFSYAGAGLKKPFWIYDRQLEKSGRIEHEARAEKVARDKWKALYDAALSLHEQE